MVIEIGKRYRIVHTRKGAFEGVVRAIDDDFVDVEITKGTAEFITEADRGKGELVTIRLSLARFTEITK